MPVSQNYNQASKANSVPLTIKTSKNWVLPPRPKPGRKPTNDKAEVPKERKKKASQDTKGNSYGENLDPTQNLGSTENVLSGATNSEKHYHSIQSSPGEALEDLHKLAMYENNPKREIQELNKNIATIDNENNILKHHLLSMINDYKHLKHLVLNSSQYIPSHVSFDDISSRKRSFTELTVNDSMKELIDNLNDLSHYSGSNFKEDKKSAGLLCTNEQSHLASRIEPSDEETDDVLNYINLGDEEEGLACIDEDEDINSSILSRTTSPSSLSETDGENSLMSSLTRSNTVSTNHSLHLDRKMTKPPSLNFYSLPEYSTSEYNFTFDKMNPLEPKMDIIEEDKYNMVTDFLEEKLMDNNVSYYVQNENLE